MSNQEAALLKRIPTQLFIDGAWRDAAEGKTLSVLDPSTGEKLVDIADASPADGVAALDAAAAAQADWAATAPRKRSDLLRDAFELVRERKDELALLITLEMGKPLAEAAGEVTYGNEFVRWFSEEAVRISGRYGQNPEGTGNIVVSHQPVGPSFFITPWNFPFAMATRKIAPALAAGCTTVIKPAELTPLTTLYFTDILREVGVTAGVVNVITTSTSSATSAPIISDPRIRKISFTGSTGVGKVLLKQAADNVLRTSMELGGNAPFLVFEDADIDAAVEGALIAKFRNIGQACTAGNRFLVHRSVAEEFAQKITEKVSAFQIGRGTEEGVNIGPLISDDAVQHSYDLVQDATSKGASVLTGGKRVDGQGYFFEPTVVNGVSTEARIFTEEIFGPVLGIIPFDTEEEAVRLANDTEYGLVSYAYTQDISRVHRLIDSLQTGMTGINAGVISNAAAPFGGVKQSGLGREGSAEGILEYLETKYTFIP